MNGQPKVEIPFGFWSRDPSDTTLPFPVANAGGEFSVQAVERLKALEKSGKTRELGYRGWSACRICRKSNGSRTFFYTDSSESLGVDMEYSWPSGFMHYLEEHNIRAPGVLFDLLKIFESKEAISG